jgi:DNA-directed RNA polymerase subunit RPC12/RpoP
MTKVKCLDCDTEIDISHLENDEFVACPCCGCEYYFKDGKLIYVELEGEGWGE